MNAGVILFLIFAVCVLIGVPISMSLGIGSLAAVALGNLGVSPAVIAQRVFGGLQSTSIMAIAFFILAGNLMAGGGISRRIVNFANCLIGNIRGGMSVALVVACAFFAALSGSAPATVVAIGSMLYADMVKQGYPEDRTAGLLVIAGGLGPVIPPSIIMVLYCTLTGASVTNMFSQGMVIGILIMIVLILEALYYAHKEKWPKAETKHTAGEIGKIFLEAVPALLTPVIILGGIYSGLLTATESAAVACVWAFIAGVFIYREIKIADLIPILMKSAKSAAMILFIIAASTAFSWVFTFSGASAALVQLVVSMNLNKTLFCLVVAIILLMIMNRDNKPSTFLNDSERMLSTVGPLSMLPMLLACLGSVFTAAGVGDVISDLVSHIIPEGNVNAGIVVYAIGMMLFTMIMGNAYAAITVMTVGIGYPFVLAHGANPVVIGMLALTCGFCGTLCTPMAANFNTVPVALLDMKKPMGVIKNQVPVAIIMMVVQIVMMILLK